MNKSDTIAELAKALSSVQGKLEGATQDSTNPYFKSKYADLSSVWNACRKLLTENGLSVAQTCDEIEGRLIIETTLLHSSGEWISGRLALNPVKNDPQGIGSAITYGRRYSLSAMVGICPEDDDAEAGMGRKKQQSQPKSNTSTSNNPASDAQIKAINTLLAKAGITESERHEKVSKILNLKADLASFHDLSKTQASTVIEMLSAEKPKTKVKEEAPETNAPAGEAKSARDRDPSTIQSIGDLYTACLQDFKMTKQQVLVELNINDQSDIVDKPGECYIRIASVR